MKKNFFLISSLIFQYFFYTNRLNTMKPPPYMKKATGMNQPSQMNSMPHSMSGAPSMNRQPVMPGNAAKKGMSPMNKQASAPLPTPKPVIETELTWPNTIELDKTATLTKTDMKIMVDLFNKAEKLYLNAQTILTNIQNMQTMYTKQFIETTEQTNTVIEEVSYKKGIVLQKLVQDKKP